MAFLGSWSGTDSRVREVSTALLATTPVHALNGGLRGSLRIHARRSTVESRTTPRAAATARKPCKENRMLYYAIVFLVIALIAGVLGFGVIAGTAASIAKILFLVFLVLFVVSLVMGRRGPGV